MMGTKARLFAPLPPVSLEELIPPDHFYRHLEQRLDLGFVRDLVRDAYAETGRPAIDPVISFKLQAAFVDGRDVRVTDDGRVTATVVRSVSGGGEVASVIEFVRVGGRFRIARETVLRVVLATPAL